MIENRISGYLYNERFTESNKEKCTPWSLKTAQLLSKHFPSGLSLFILYLLFDKGKDTSAIPQPSVRHLVYVLPP